MNRASLVLRPWLVGFVLAITAPACRATAPAAPAPPRAATSVPTAPAHPPSLAKDVFPHHVKPHWLPDHTHLFYRTELADGVREYFLVDATTGERTALFDQARLAAALTKITRKPFESDHLNLHRLELDAQRTRMTFSVAERHWRCDLQTYVLQPEPKTHEADSLRLASSPTTRTGPATELTFINGSHGTVVVSWMDFEGHRKRYATLPPGGRHTQPTYAGHVWVMTDDADRVLMAFETPEDGGEYAVDDEDVPLAEPPAARKPAPAAPAEKPTGVTSPDGHHFAFVKDHNVYLRDARGIASVALSHDGTADDSYADDDLAWSPDSTRLVALRTKKGDDRKVYLIESSPRDQLQPRLSSYDYLKPGDRIPVQKPHLFDVRSRSAIAVSDALFPRPWSISEVRWSSDSKHF
ncbi:MAG TPA: DPP IV N-terminal domain-containing protein, partial [Polyangiaceae bacterium]|nr:DPP IV N-terminal domain-containing protein [Polyangiaceae bacterium]